MTELKVDSSADMVCPHCGGHVPGARLTFRSIALREAHEIAVLKNTTVEELLGKRRRHTRARWALWDRLSTTHGWPNARIARVLGNTDSSTVLRALQVLRAEQASKIEPPKDPSVFPHRKRNACSVAGGVKP